VVRGRTDVADIFPSAATPSSAWYAVLAEQNDEPTEPRGHMGLEILATCRKALRPIWERITLVRLD
jgi:hypothetical protein